MKYLITGTNGFIGYHLANALSKNKDNKIFAVDKSYTEGLSDNVTPLARDLKLQDCSLPDVDIVIHLAAFNGTKWFYEKAYDVIKDNILSTITLLDRYKKSDIKRFVYAGTPESTALATEFFNYPIPTDELAPIGVKDVKNKRWSYANSKALGEQAVIASNLPYTIIRYNNVYGPRQKDHFISEFYERAVKGDYTLYGWQNTRTFIYIDDAIRATELLLNTDKSINEIYNLGGINETTIAEVADTMLQVMGINGKLIFKDAPEGSTMRRLPDTTKLRTHTGFVQEIDLYKGLELTIESLK